MTEIAPGMMVECINNSFSSTEKAPISVAKLKIGGRYIVKSYHPKSNAGPCICLVGFPNYEERFIAPIGKVKHEGFKLSRFRPIGGDKEIEIEQFKKLGFDKMLNYFEKVKNDG